MEVTDREKLIIRQVAVKCACDTYSIRRGADINAEMMNIKKIALAVEKIVLEV